MLRCCESYLVLSTNSSDQLLQCSSAINAYIAVKCLLIDPCPFFVSNVDMIYVCKHFHLQPIFLKFMLKKA